MNNEMVKVESIRKQYMQKTVTKMDELKALDRRVKRSAEIFGYVFGSIGALVLGTGMCLAMKVIGNAMALGIVIGVLGLAAVSLTYPLYKKILEKRKQKYVAEIFSLSDEILNK